MKKILSIIATLLLSVSTFVLAENTYVPSTPHNYYSGSKGGCYYYNSNGNKTYVARYLCSSGNTPSPSTTNNSTSTSTYTVDKEKSEEKEKTIGKKQKEESKTPTIIRKRRIIRSIIGNENQDKPIITTKKKRVLTIR